MPENKVQFNIRNMHYAVLTSDGAGTDGVDGTPTYETPVSVPGTVNLNLSASGEMSPFYADGIVYYQSSQNNGYEGGLEMARFTDQMLQDVWGFILAATDNVLVEKADVEPKPFALLFEINGDKDNDLYCLYNCTGTRPAIAGATSTETKDPQTQTSTISATPLASNNLVFARTTSTTPSTVRQNWFKQVYVPSSEALQTAAAAGKAGQPAASPVQEG